MAQRILVIGGSPRKGGNTDLLSDEFIRGAQEAEYYEVFLATMRQFIGCFQNMREAGSIIGYQAQKKGEIKSNEAMDKAYDMGRTIK